MTTLQLDNKRYKLEQLNILSLQNVLFIAYNKFIRPETSKEGEKAMKTIYKEYERRGMKNIDTYVFERER